MTAFTYLRIFAVRHRSTGAGRPQCRRMANCDGCAYLRTVARSIRVLAGPRGRAPTVLAPANCDGCAYLRPVIPTRRARLAVSRQSARVGCWTGLGRRLGIDWSTRHPSRIRERFRERGAAVRLRSHNKSRRNRQNGIEWSLATLCFSIETLTEALAGCGTGRDAIRRQCRPCCLRQFWMAARMSILENSRLGLA